MYSSRSTRKLTRLDPNVVSVGGIYTVIKTKAAVTTEELGDQYCMIGPYNESCVRTEVEILEPSSPPMVATLAQMREHGIKVPYLLKLPTGLRVRLFGQDFGGPPTPIP